jgi:hypothetical protein
MFDVDAWSFAGVESPWLEWRIIEPCSFTVGLGVEFPEFSGNLKMNLYQSNPQSHLSFIASSSSRIIVLGEWIGVFISLYRVNRVSRRNPSKALTGVNGGTLIRLLTLIRELKRMSLRSNQSLPVFRWLSSIIRALSRAIFLFDRRWVAIVRPRLSRPWIKRPGFRRTCFWDVDQDWVDRNGLQLKEGTFKLKRRHQPYSSTPLA